MTQREHRFLLSEQATLQNMIARISPGNIVTRKSFEARLEQVQDELKAYDGLSPRSIKARLTFRGKPVRDSYGVSADFAGEAVNYFADAVATVGAGSRAPLGQRFDLVITGTARGSFGFEIEDATQTPSHIGESTPVEAAIEQIMEIMKASTETDEHLAAAISETDPRALSAIRKFLKTVADNDAICALQLNDDVFAFRDNAQVQTSADRLGEWAAARPDTLSPTAN